MAKLNDYKKKSSLMHQNFNHSTPNLQSAEIVKEEAIITHEIQNSYRQDYITGTFPSPIKS